MSAKLAFLLGIFTGVVLSILLAIVGTVVIVRAFLPETIEESLQVYRNVVETAAVDIAEREPVLKKVASIQARAKSQPIGFFAWVDATGDLDDFTKDCRITQEEWPLYSVKVSEATTKLGITVKD